jgi:hypothetical protein
VTLEFEMTLTAIAPKDAGWAVAGAWAYEDHLYGSLYNDAQ